MKSVANLRRARQLLDNAPTGEIGVDALAASGNIFPGASGFSQTIGADEGTFDVSAGIGLKADGVAPLGQAFPHRIQVSVTLDVFTAPVDVRRARTSTNARDLVPGYARPGVHPHAAALAAARAMGIPPDQAANAASWVTRGSAGSSLAGPLAQLVAAYCDVLLQREWFGIDVHGDVHHEVRPAQPRGRDGDDMDPGRRMVPAAQFWSGGQAVPLTVCESTDFAQLMVGNMPGVAYLPVDALDDDTLALVRAVVPKNDPQRAGGASYPAVQRTIWSDVAHVVLVVPPGVTTEHERAQFQMFAFTAEARARAARVLGDPGRVGRLTQALASRSGLNNELYSAYNLVNTVLFRPQSHSREGGQWRRAMGSRTMPTTYGSTHANTDMTQPSQPPSDEADTFVLPASAQHLLSHAASITTAVHGIASCYVRDIGLLYAGHARTQRAWIHADEVTESCGGGDALLRALVRSATGYTLPFTRTFGVGEWMSSLQRQFEGHAVPAFFDHGIVACLYGVAEADSPFWELLGVTPDGREGPPTFIRPDGSVMTRPGRTAAADPALALVMGAIGGGPVYRYDLARFAAEPAPDQNTNVLRRLDAEALQEQLGDDWGFVLAWSSRMSTFMHPDAMRAYHPSVGPISYHWSGTEDARAAYRAYHDARLRVSWIRVRLAERRWRGQVAAAVSPPPDPHEMPDETVPVGKGTATTAGLADWDAERAANVLSMTAPRPRFGAAGPAMRRARAARAGPAEDDDAAAAGAAEHPDAHDAGGEPPAEPVGVEDAPPAPPEA